MKVFDGKYGPYVSHDGMNATLPGDIAPAELTMDRAVDLLAERAARTGGGKKKKTKAKAKPAADAAKGPPKGVKKSSKKKPPGATPEAAD